MSKADLFLGTVVKKKRRKSPKRIWMCLSCQQPFRIALQGWPGMSFDNNQIYRANNRTSKKRYGKCIRCGLPTFLFWPSNEALHSALGFKLASRAIALRSKILLPHPDSAPSLRD